MDNPDDQSVTIDIPETPAQEVTPLVETPIESPVIVTKVIETLSNRYSLEPKIEPQIERNEKGQITKGVAQDTNKNGTAGAPCTYCQDKEAKQKIVDDYMKSIYESVKFAVPWIEEVALLLDVDDGTLVNWANKKDDNDKREHPELYATYSRLKSLQKLRLKQRAIGRFNPHGALYLLGSDHNVIQASKQILANDKDEPLKIMFVDEKPIPGEQDE